jgi:integrase
MFREKALKHLLAAFGGVALKDITVEHVDAYLQARRDAGAAPGTVNRERTVFGHVFGKAMKWGIATENPVKQTEKQAEPDGIPRPLTHDEERRLFAILPAHYTPFVTLALHTGLRLGELRAQAWKDIDLEQGTLIVTRPKSGKREVLPLNQTARRLLASLERTGPLLFPAIPKKLSDLFIKYAKRAGLADVTFHCCRDTFISRLAPFVSATTLMTLARHRDLRTTRRYLKIEEAHLKAAVERLSETEIGNESSTGRSTEKMAVAQLLDSLGIAG